MFVISVAILLAVVVSYWYYVFFYYYGYLKKIPSPTVWPLIGNAFAFKDTYNFIFDLENQLKKRKTKSLRIHLPTYTLVMTTDYSVVEHIVTHADLNDKGIEYDCFKNWVGNSIFTSAGNQWRDKRQMLAPTFHYKILEQFFEVISCNGNILVNKMKKLVGVKSLDIQSLVSLCILDITCETAMGTSINAHLNDNSEYLKSITRLGQIVAKRAIHPVYSNNFLYQFTKLKKEEQHHIDVIRRYHDDMIHNRKQKYLELQNQEISNRQVDYLGRKNKLPFLDMLLHIKVDEKPLSHVEIENEVATLLTAANDTTSNALSFALFELSKHPTIQQKCVDELESIFGRNKNRPCSYSDIQQMKYLELVIKETLRLYSPATLFTRRVKKSFTIDGITYPQGVTIGVFIYGIHRDESNYENPAKFDPERFSVDRFNANKPFVFIPFSAGSRNCIGQKFAWMTLKTLLSLILRNFHITSAVPHDKIQITSDIVLRSINGVNITLKERTY